MIAGLKPYPKYRDSGVEWLGKVPEGWEVRRLANVFHRIVGGATPASSKAEFWGGDVVWATPTDVAESPTLADSRRHLTLEGLAACSAGLVPVGSIILTSRAPVGNVAVARVPMATNQGCKALVPDPTTLDSRFAFNLVAAMVPVLKSRSVGTTFSELPYATLRTVSAPVPPLDVQAAIGQFLEFATNRVQRCVTAMERLIDLLEEEKQAVIHRAVTRGLDPTVRLKPSGVDWFGDVPEHWEVVSLGRLLTSIDQGMSPVAANTSFEDDQWAVLTLTSVNRGEFDGDATKPVPRDVFIPERLELADGDFLMTRANSRDRVGDVCIVSGVRPRALMSDLIYRLVFNDRLIDPHFLRCVLLSRVGRDQIERLARGSNESMPKISQGAVKSLIIPVPPIREQHLIAAAMSQHLEIPASGKQAAGRQIELLDELRTRLISDVVTGKLDVREATARLPEELALDAAVADSLHEPLSA